MDRLRIVGLALVEARDRLSTPEKWGKGNYRGAHVRALPDGSLKVTQWRCSVAAIEEAVIDLMETGLIAAEQVPGIMDGCHDAVASAIGYMPSRESRAHVISFNDDTRTTYGMVRDVFEVAINRVNTIISPPTKLPEPAVTSTVSFASFVKGLPGFQPYGEEAIVYERAPATADLSVAGD